MKKIYTIAIVSLIYCNLSAQVMPVVCYPLNGNAQDFSGNDYHGTVFGAVPDLDRFGNPGGAYLFDGIDDFISIDTNLSNYLPNNEITIAFWAKTLTFKTNSPFLLVPDNASDRLNIHIHYDHNSVPAFFLDYGNISSGGRLAHLNVPFVSLWEHFTFVVTESGDSMCYYKDGIVQFVKQGMSPLINKNKILNVGGGMAGAVNLHYSGLLDDVQIFDVALNAQEIFNNYTQGLVCETKSGLNTISESTISIYPNPANEIINVNSNFAVDEYSIEIIDITGRSISQIPYSANNSNLQIDISTLTKGLYFIKLNNGNSIYTARFSKF